MLGGYGVGVAGVGCGGPLLLLLLSLTVGSPVPVGAQRSALSIENEINKYERNGTDASEQGSAYIHVTI